MISPILGTISSWINWNCIGKSWSWSLSLLSISILGGEVGAFLITVMCSLFTSVDNPARSTYSKSLIISGISVPGVLTHNFVCVVKFELPSLDLSIFIFLGSCLPSVHISKLSNTSIEAVGIKLIVSKTSPV